MSQTETNIERFAREARERDSLESAENLKTIRTANWFKLCPPNYREFDWSKAPAIDRGKAAHILSWRHEPGGGLFVYGQTGRCKTRLCYQAIKTAALAGASVKILDGIAFAVQASKAMMDSENTEKWIYNMVKPDVLFIDDIAKRVTPTTAQALFAVVEGRMSWNRPILITSNVTPDQLRQLMNDESLSEPTIRRLGECCEVVIL